ncbi:MAG: hypothetical protein ACK4FL_01340 [Microgenomates group bacterium]
MKVLADSVEDVFGKISPPPGMNIGVGDPVQALANFVGFGVRVFIIVAAGALLVYMFWGAFDWITSGGEKEKVAKAQQKITNAVIGMILVFAALTIFGLLTGNILGIIVNENGVWKLQIPTMQ